MWFQVYFFEPAAQKDTLVEGHSMKRKIIQISRLLSVFQNCLESPNPDQSSPTGTGIS